MIKKADDNKMTEVLLMKYVKELENPDVNTFIKHPACPSYEAAFLNNFTYISHNDSTKRLHPPFVNSYQSLVLDPSASLLKDNRNSDYSKTNILSTSRINKMYFAIKVFNYLYAGFKNISLEDAGTPEAKLLYSNSS